LIPVALKPEPAEFNKKVRRPGNDANPKVVPNWKWASAELYAAYQRVCAYSSMYLAFPHYSSIDHFHPRSVRPDLEFEWKNFRLCQQRLNSYKTNKTGLIDPFEAELGWFVLDFPSCLVRPGLGLSEALTQKIDRTIHCLKLNLDDTFVQERCDIMVMFAQGSIGLQFLDQRYPFLAHEVRRQGLETTAGQVFKTLQ
jgi:hypothetical protein